MNQNQLNSFSEIDTSFLSYPVTLVYMNIRSLRLNFIPLLATLHNIIDKINFIVLVETNINNEEQHAYNISGFNSYFLNRDNRGGGIAVYVKESIIHTNISLHTSSFESVQINITNNNKTMYLLSIYRPPKNNVNEFITELDKIINSLKNKRDVIIVGDMNINIQNQNITTTKYVEMISSNGLQCLINETTREDITKNASSCIDHIHVRNNNTNTQTYAAVIKTNISDHYSLFCCVKEEEIEKNKHQGSESVLFQGTKINNFLVNKKIIQTNWNEIINENMNTNEMFNKIYETFTNIYEKSQSKSKHNKKKNRKSNPWMCEDLIKNCEQRDKLYTKWLNNKTNKNCEYEYKKFRNFLNKKLYYAKNNYYKRKFVEYRNDIRVTWQIINEITGKKINNIDSIIKNNFKNENVINIANNFAKSFNDNVQKILHNCVIKTSTTQNTALRNSMFLSPATEEEIYNILATLNINKGAGADNIRPKDLKNNCSLLTPTITTLINSSLNDGTIPQLLKTSLIRPIYKSGTKNDYNNYRPIAILPIIEKILE